MKTCMSWAVGVGAAVSLAAYPAHAAQRALIVAAQYLTPPNSLFAGPVWFGFHDGTFITYQKGALASSALTAFINGPLITPMREALLAHQADAVTDGLANGPPPDIDNFFNQGAATYANVDTVKDRFFSYLARITPSDDAFVGNEDPNAVPVFDTNGAFLGPIVIDIYGTRVLDAGVRQNDEQGLLLLDANATGTSSSPPESLPIRQHPGFNGSLRNPTGTPVRILGGSRDNPGDPYYLHYDSVAADFTQPNFPILRLRISMDVDGDFGGNWYAPDRSGEGFSLQISNSAEPTIAVEWYTYAPDGSGTPIWLVGSAPLIETGALVTVELDQTTGGRFASTQNPSTVQRIPWGTIMLGFSDCSDGAVYYQPTNPAFPSGMYLIQRVVPGWYPVNYKCASNSLDASFPIPVN
jgi:hypothetical protein